LKKLDQALNCPVTGAGGKFVGPGGNSPRRPGGGAVAPQFLFFRKPQVTAPVAGAGRLPAQTQLQNVIKIVCLILGLWAGLAGAARAQTLYVDAVNGRSAGTGTPAAPLASLEQAVALAQEFTGQEPVVLKLAPGLYTLTRPAEIRTRGLAPDTARYTVEAAVLPDDPAWQPTKMPVIQSVSADGFAQPFAHAVGFLVARSNVRFRGLKFVGNAHPGVRNYYPINRKNEAYRGLTVAQCYFIGERNSSPIQGAIWAHGAGGLRVDHTIFYNCKNALIFGQHSTSGFSLTHSVIYGAYEAAIWFDPTEAKFTGFTFDHNVITKCDYVWIRSAETSPDFAFRNSLIADNAHYIGLDTDKGVVENPENKHREQGIRKTGVVLLREVKTEGLPRDYLNLVPQSAGYDLKAGLFKAARP